MNLFYVKSEDVQSDRLTIRGQEARHISKVLRFQIGDNIWVTDGMGTLFECKITGIKKESTELQIISKKREKTGERKLTLCMGIIKKRDRLEFAVEKAVELGVNEIILFKGDRSQKQNVRADRIELTVLSAMKQSLRTYLPGISVAPALKKALVNIPDKAVIVIADENTDAQKIPNLKQDIIGVVGPEGGFSNNEMDFLKEIGGISYSLGPKRLRTETAAIVMADRFKSNK